MRYSGLDTLVLVRTRLTPPLFEKTPEPTVERILVLCVFSLERIAVAVGRIFVRVKILFGIVRICLYRWCGLYHYIYRIAHGAGRRDAVGFCGNVNDICNRFFLTGGEPAPQPFPYSCRKTWTFGKRRRNSFAVTVTMRNHVHNAVTATVRIRIWYTVQRAMKVNRVTSVVCPLDSGVVRIDDDLASDLCFMICERDKRNQK